MLRSTDKKPAFFVTKPPPNLSPQASSMQSSFADDISLRNISKKTVPIKDSKAALTRFTIQFDDRMNSLAQKSHSHKTLDPL
jgi:hypothetical protein